MSGRRFPGKEKVFNYAKFFSMRIFIIAAIAAILLCYACGSGSTRDAEGGIRQAETDFAAMAGKEGVAAAFEHFAADSGVINRGGKIYKGKAAIAAYYAQWPYREVKLTWSPEFISASASGDMGYTYGRYRLLATDSSGASIDNTGYFHTVWQRQHDGSWRFVYD